MHFRHLLLPSLLSIGLVAASYAAGTVQLELVGDTRGAAMVFQEWAQSLGKAGIKNVRIRTAQDADKVGIDVQGTPDHPVYVVTGIVNSRDELLLPGGRFKRSDAGRLAQWLNDLAANGPSMATKEKAAFGLSPKQFQQVHEDLATPVGFATQGMTRDKVVEKIAARLKLTLKLDAEVARALADDKLSEELSDLSCGTALAYVLRPAGYCLAPRPAGGQIAYAVIKAQPDLEVWPVGWATQKSPNESLQGLFEFLNVNVQNVTAAEALAVIGKRLKAPVLIDHNALARHGIDPAKTTVSLPRSRTTYSLALRKLLFQAGLKFEVRLDEAGAPFLWVTTVKPV